MEPRSNYTPEQLIGSKPDIDNELACAAWFADCMRWADIERVEDIKNIAWRANEELQEYCKRHQAIEVLIGKLQAYIKIVCTETPKEPNLNPELYMPDGVDQHYTSFDSTLNINDPEAGFDWPTAGQTAKSPELPKKKEATT